MKFHVFSHGGEKWLVGRVKGTTDRIDEIDGGVYRLSRDVEAEDGSMVARAGEQFSVQERGTRHVLVDVEGRLVPPKRANAIIRHLSGPRGG